MIKWVALTAVLLVLIGTVVWAASVNGNRGCVGGAMHADCQMDVSECPQTGTDVPAACHDSAPDRAEHPRGAAGRGDQTCHEQMH